MKTYRELDIYKISYDLALKVHRMTLRLPQYETYEEGSQLRRSSKGIASCIVVRLWKEQVQSRIH
jgi:four helix bundle protein